MNWYMFQIMKPQGKPVQKFLPCRHDYKIHLLSVRLKHVRYLRLDTVTLWHSPSNLVNLLVYATTIQNIDD